MRQYGKSFQPEPFNSPFRSAAVRNVIPDPDVPAGCDPNSPEYGHSISILLHA